MYDLYFVLFLYDLLWFLPLLTGVVSIVYITVLFRRRERINIILSCYGLSILLLALGSFGSWMGAKQIWATLGAAGNISIELIYSGWKNSWLPLIIAGSCSLILFGIAIAAKRNKSIPLSAPKSRDKVITMAVPPMITVVSFITVQLLELIFTLQKIPMVLYPVYTVFVVSLYLIPTIGIPYMIIWGIYLYRKKYSTSSRKGFLFLLSFYVVFLLLTLTITVLWYYSLWQGTNPLISF